MKKKTQKIIALVLIAMLGFAGCAKQQGEDITTTAATTQPNNFEEIAGTTAQNENTEAVKTGTTPIETEMATSEPITETETPTAIETLTETTQETTVEPEPEPEPTPTPEPHKHSYKEKVIAPTCTEKGYTTYTCECGDTYKDKETKALGHSFTNYVYNNDATLEEGGTQTAKCDNSGCKETRTMTAPGTRLEPTWDECNKTMWVAQEYQAISVAKKIYGSEELVTLYKGDEVVVTGTSEYTTTCRIKVNGKTGYAHYAWFTDVNPNPTPEPEIKYDGYDEFGNGYVWGQMGGKTYKFYKADFPYDQKKIYEVSDTELYVYGMEGEAGMEMAAGALLQERFGTTARFEKTTTILGIYNGKLCGRTDFRMVDN